MPPVRYRHVGEISLMLQTIMCAWVGGVEEGSHHCVLFEKCRIIRIKYGKVSTRFQPRSETKTPLASFLIKNLAWESVFGGFFHRAVWKAHSLTSLQIKGTMWLPLLIFKSFSLHPLLARVPAAHCMCCYECLKHGTQRASFMLAFSSCHDSFWAWRMTGCDASRNFELRKWVEELVETIRITGLLWRRTLWRKVEVTHWMIMKYNKTQFLMHSEQSRSSKSDSRRSDPLSQLCSSRDCSPAIWLHMFFIISFVMV